MSIATMSADIGAELAARKRLRSASRLSTAVAAADDRSGRFPGGEGITRCSTAGRLWKVRVEFQFGGRPMLATVRAVDEAQALDFTLARHPSAIRSRTAVLGPAA